MQLHEVAVKQEHLVKSAAAAASVGAAPVEQHVRITVTLAVTVVIGLGLGASLVWLLTDGTPHPGDNTNAC